ncbi:MAG: DUF3822 family protein, partial [Bacteroidales bacterium]|nr:DUF3822 family protein [Bacteroidales bacterium]
ELRLSICLRSNGFSFSTTTVGQELLTFGEADFDFHLPISQLPQAIKVFFAENGIPTFGCKQVRLIVPSEHFVWVPEHLYDATRDRQYLKMASRVESSVGAYHAYSDVMKSYMVFTAPTDVITAFKVAIPGIDVMSQHSVLANAELLQRSAQHPVVLMHVRDGVGDFEAFYNNQLLLSNSFSAESDNELLYHALDVMKTLHLETPDMELAICGSVGREIYALLQHYFPNVTLYTGRPFSYSNPTFQTLHTYRHALLLS